MEKFDVSSVGILFRNSLEMFAEKIVDDSGNEIQASSMKINDKAFAVFESGTGKTRTSLVRIS